MHSTIQILDLARKNAGGTDYKVGKKLNISLSRVSNWRTGKSTIDDGICAEVARLAGLNGDYVLACVNAERAKSRTVKLAYSRLARLAKATEAACFLLLAPLGIWITERAAELCILC